jgi:hypothetical protein
MIAKIYCGPRELITTNIEPLKVYMGTTNGARGIDPVFCTVTLSNLHKVHALMPDVKRSDSITRYRSRVLYCNSIQSAQNEDKTITF